MRAFVNINNIAYITLLCVVLCFEWSTQDKMHLHIMGPAVKELREQAEICSQQTGVPAANLRKIIDKTLSDERANKEFFHCVALNTGYIDNNSKFVAAKFIGLEIKEGTPEAITNTINECNKISLGDNIDTAYAEADCVHDAIHFTA
ncbi:uncharacterized protein [Epargyreus clarus]|uniref:uncharacterized protein n=1 Tax=Epargyreus clarus TaxID=520877 RepID=UPI003C2BDB56